MLRLLFGFLPWIILAVLGEWSLTLALVLGLAAAVFIPALGKLRHRTLKIPDIVTIAFFAVMVIAIVVFRWMALASYLSLLASVTLMAIAWGSLLVGAPFTLQYAREQVSPEISHSRAFMSVNRYITAVWGLDFSLAAVMSVYRLVSGNQSLIWKHAWIVLALGAALFTVYFPAWYRTRVLGQVPQATPRNDKAREPP